MKIKTLKQMLAGYAYDVIINTMVTFAEATGKNFPDRLRGSESYVQNILSEEVVRDVVIPRITEEYRSIIRPNDLNEKGLFKDSYLDPKQSIWFGEGLMPNQVSGLDIFARLVKPLQHAGIETLQIHIDELSEATRQRLWLLDEEQVAEFGSLITVAPGSSSPLTPFRLMGKMRHYSLDHGVRYWICGFVPQEEPHFVRLLGPALERLGNHAVAFGNFSIKCQPYLINLKEGMTNLHESGMIDPLHRRVSAIIDPQTSGAAA